MQLTRREVYTSRLISCTPQVVGLDDAIKFVAQRRAGIFKRRWRPIDATITYHGAWLVEMNLLGSTGLGSNRAVASTCRMILDEQTGATGLVEDVVSTRWITAEETSVLPLSRRPEVVRESAVRELKANFIALYRTIPSIHSVRCDVFYRPRWKVRCRNAKGVQGYVYIDADEYGVRR